MEKRLSGFEKQYLLKLARETIIKAVNHEPLPGVEKSQLSAELINKGASFVTLTIGGELRGCIGSLEAYQSLVDDVQEHAVQSALSDYRFSSVTLAEVPRLKIEISRLTLPVPLKYEHPLDLADLIHAHIDGVILKDGPRRATFLPQVWGQIPQPEEFLAHLCAKMGASANLWRHKMLEVSIYHVEEFEED